MFFYRFIIRILFDIRKTLWFSKLMFVLQQLDFPLILFTSILFNGPSGFATWKNFASSESGRKGQYFSTGQFPLSCLWQEKSTNIPFRHYCFGKYALEKKRGPFLCFTCFELQNMSNTSSLQVVLDKTGHQIVNNVYLDNL